jgi:hypothetical protein
MVAYVSCRKRALASECGKGTRKGRGKGKKARKWKKDTILTERTYRSIANKVLSSFEVCKTNWFLSARTPKRTRKSGQKPTFCAKSSRNSWVEWRRRMGER